ncbi:MAG TPA: hypothetical protein VFU98_17550 [Microlunatus sp.]|nr:hypothetical protein [Microlunatus sp.]
MTALLVLAGVAAVALPWLSRQLEDAETPTTSLRPTQPPEQVRAVSIDFGIVTDPSTDWSAVDARLDQVGATTVDLNAGRTEFTAFDWPAHPEAAAESGTDHLAVASEALHSTADGSTRQTNLIVDAFVPAWIESDPSIAGVDARGRRSPYTASAAQLAEGAVGERLVEYVTALGGRYDPNQIQITELFLDTYTYGADDLDLYRRMTGAADWPRDANGSIDTEASAIGVWRSEVLAGVMGRLRTALSAVRDGGGRDIGLVLDVRVNWSDPAAGRPMSGHDYTALLAAGVDLQLWVYIGRADKPPTGVEKLTAGLASGGYDMSRFIVSVGLWAGEPDADPPGRITPEALRIAVEGAATNGITAVGVTPCSLMTDAHWAALAAAWS